MQHCSVILVCKGITYNSFIDIDMDNYDDLKFAINGIEIRVELNDVIYIENVNDYSDKQLSFLSLIKKNNAGVLTDYDFKLCFPIKISNKHTHEVISTLLEVEMKQEDNHKTCYICSLLNAQSQLQDIDLALSDLKKQLSNLYDICICGCCKYGQAFVLYGADPYLNFFVLEKIKLVTHN